MAENTIYLNERLCSTDNFYEALFRKEVPAQRRCRGISEELLAQLVMTVIVRDDDYDLAAERVLKFFGIRPFYRVDNPSEEFVADVERSLEELRAYADEILTLYGENSEHNVLDYAKALLSRIVPDKQRDDDAAELAKAKLSDLDVSTRVKEALLRAARDHSRDLDLLDGEGDISVRKLTRYSARYLMERVRNFGQGSALELETALAKRGWHLLGGGALIVKGRLSA